jgi:hypothetical protein
MNYRGQTTTSTSRQKLQLVSNDNSAFQASIGNYRQEVVFDIMSYLCSKNKREYISLDEVIITKICYKNKMTLI